MFLLLSVSTTIWHVDCACLLRFVEQRPCSLFIALDVERSAIAKAFRIFPLIKSSVHYAEGTQFGIYPCSFFPARGPGRGGGVRGDQLKGLVVTEVRAITIFHLVFCFFPYLDTSSLLLTLDETQLCS